MNNIRNISISSGEFPASPASSIASDISLVPSSTAPIRGPQPSLDAPTGCCPSLRRLLDSFRHLKVPDERQGSAPFDDTFNSIMQAPVKLLARTVTKQIEALDAWQLTPNHGMPVDAFLQMLVQESRKPGRFDAVMEGMQAWIETSWSLSDVHGEDFVDKVDRACWKILINEVKSGVHEDSWDATQIDRKLRRTPEPLVYDSLISAARELQTRSTSVRNRVFNTLDLLVPNLNARRLRTLALNFSESDKQLHLDEHGEIWLTELCERISNLVMCAEESVRNAHVKMTATSPVSHIPSEAPRMPTECMIHWMSSVEQIRQQQNLTLDQVSVLEDIADDCKRKWTSGNLSCAATHRYFHAVQKMLDTTELAELAQLAKELESQLPGISPLEQWCDLLRTLYTGDLSLPQRNEIKAMIGSAKALQEKLEQAHENSARHLSDLEGEMEECGMTSLAHGARMLAGMARRTTPFILWEGMKKKCERELNNSTTRSKVLIRRLQTTLLMVDKQIRDLKQLHDELAGHFRYGKQYSESEDFKEMTEWAEKLEQQVSGSGKVFTAAELEPRLNDSVYRRVHESIFVTKLLEAKVPDVEKKSHMEFARAWKDVLINLVESQDMDAIHEMAVLFRDATMTRPQSWVTKVPLLHAFMNAPDQSCADALLKFLDTDFTDGYACAALSVFGYLGNMLAEMGFCQLVPWKDRADTVNSERIVPYVSRILVDRPEHEWKKANGITLSYQVPVLEDEAFMKGTRPVDFYQMQLNLQESSPPLRAALAHGLTSVGVSGTTNLKMFMVDHFRKQGYEIDFKYALLGSIRHFISGHSLYDVLWTVRMLSREGHIQWKVDLDRFSEDEIALDPRKAHIPDIEGFLALYDEPEETGILVRQAWNDALQETIEYFRANSTYAQESRNIQDSRI